MDRRTFAISAAMGLLGATVARRALAQDHSMEMFPASWQGNEQIVFLAYPGMTALDLVGPHHMLSSLWGATVRLVARTRAPVKSDMGLVFTPDITFDEMPGRCDVLCVPGAGSGVLAAMQDGETLDFLRAHGRAAGIISSVCTGSLLLGNAGLLDGYLATSHWTARDALAMFGATPVDARVVTDRNRVTGAGVTAGIDFGLELVARLRDRSYAEMVQLLAEYDPDPPFDAGTPKTAPPETVALVRGMFDEFQKDLTRLGNQ